MSEARPSQAPPGRLDRLFQLFLSEEIRALPPNTLRRIRFSVGAYLTFLTVTLLLGPIIYATEGFSLNVIALLITAPVCVLNLFIHRWTRTPGTASGAFFCLMVAVLIVITSTGGKGPVADCIPQWHVAIPLLAGFLAGNAAALLCGGVGLAHLSILAVISASHAPLSSNDEFWGRLATLFVASFTLTVALIYESSRRRAEHDERRYLEEQGRLGKELEIAARIQTSILPVSLEVSGLEIATRMLPASEIGGDYYDVLPAERGCWIGIGDVSGHGLTAGLIMMMLQSIVATLSQEHPDATPRELLNRSNRVLFNNIRNRLKKDDYITLSLLRYYDDGRVAIAGAHEDVVFYRARERRCETVATKGTWLGAMKDIERFTQDVWCELREGDVVLLYTDGVTEAMDARGEQFGLDRLLAELEQVGELSVEEIRDRLLERVRQWSSEQRDDVTLLVLRHRGVARQSAAA